MDFIPLIINKKSKDPNTLEKLLNEERDNNKVLTYKINLLELQVEKMKNNKGNTNIEEELKNEKIKNEELKKRNSQLENILIKETSKSTNLNIKVNELGNELKISKNECQSNSLKITKLENSVNQLKNSLNCERSENQNLNIKIDLLKKKFNQEIKEKEDIIKKLTNELKEEKNKNINLNKNLENNNKINNSKLIGNNDKEIINLYQERDELKKKLLRFPFELLEGEKLISVLFSSHDNKIKDYSIICKNKEIFSAVENRLYKKYPDYIEKENFFLVNGKKINRNKSLEFNNIHDNDKVIFYPFEEDD